MEIKHIEAIEDAIRTYIEAETAIEEAGQAYAEAAETLKTVKTQAEAEGATEDEIDELFEKNGLH